MIPQTKEEKLEELKEKLASYETRLKEKKLGYGEVTRTRFGDSYEDQLRDDTNLLESMVKSIKEEIILLENE